MNQYPEEKQGTHLSVEGASPEKRSHEESMSSSYRVREIGLNEDLSGILEGWKQCNRDFDDHTIHCDPDWLFEQFKSEKENVRIYLCERNGEILGAVPFVRRKQPLLCQLGDLVVAKFPLCVLTLQGYTPNVPAEESAYDALFDSILKSRFDAIFMNYVNANSLLWKYLLGSPLIGKFFRFYSKRGPEPHLLIRLNGTFDSYIQGFSAKTRNTFHRKIKRLRQEGNIQVIRVTEASQLDEYLSTAAEISRKTWQFKRLGWGIGGTDQELVRGKLGFLAQRGWLRAYLLKCGDKACAFITGWQYGSRFYHAGLGFDPAWSNYSVGTVLQWLVLEDLYKTNTPELYDFGTSAEYKKHFSTESYQEAVVWLFRRRPYPLLADGLHRVFDTASSTTASVLSRLGLKAKIKHMLRGAR